MGFANLGAMVTTNAANQIRSPAPLRGRAIALYFAVASGSSALGALLMGTLVDAVGPRLTLVIGAAVCFVVAATWRRNGRRAATGPGVTPGEIVSTLPGLDG
jgi:MFS family permease